MSDRRGFFRDLLREVAGVAQELSEAMRDAAEVEPDPLPRPPPARPATAAVDEKSLLALCDDVGLGPRADDVRRLARGCLRLTRADHSAARSRIGGVPDLPPGFVWPSRHGRELAFLAQVDLAEVAATDPETILPRRGLMLFFFDLAARPSGLSASHRESCRVLVADGELAPDETHASALRACPLELSRELMLPDGWSFQAEELDLTLDEHDAWDELSYRLAHAQGIRPASTSVPHRLLGYHDEIGREVELDCALAAAGLDAEDADVYFAHRPDLEGEARRWRLLLQVNAEDSDEFERLYICIRDDELRGGAFDGAWAVCRAG